MKHNNCTRKWENFELFELFSLSMRNACSSGKVDNLLWSRVVCHFNNNKSRQPKTTQWKVRINLYSPEILENNGADAESTEKIMIRKQQCQPSSSSMGGRRRWKWGATRKSVKFQTWECLTPPPLRSFCDWNYSNELKQHEKILLGVSWENAVYIWERDCSSVNCECACCQSFRFHTFSSRETFSSQIPKLEIFFH